MEKNMHNRRAGIKLGLASLATGVVVSTTGVGSALAQSTRTASVAVSIPMYTISQDGTRTVAQNMITGNIDYSGPNAAQVINQAIARVGQTQGEGGGLI